MRQDDIADVRPLPLFQGLTEDRVAALLKVSYLQRFPAQVELVREGDPADFLHVVVDGQVEVFATYRDRETTVSVLGPGESFIVAAVILDRVYLKSARALVPSRVLLLPAEAVRHAFDADGAFARALALEMALAYRNIVKELKNQKLRSNLERLSNWLLGRAMETGNHDTFDLPFEKKVLAARLGMAPEVLSRAFASLSAYGVTVTGKTVTLRNREDLERLARPSETIDDPAV